MSKLRLDQFLLQKKMAETRSQAENYIKLGYVMVAGEVVQKPGHFVDQAAEVKLTLLERYVSRAAYKLASVTQALKINFKGKVVLDIGSSTGGFTDYALQHGATKVIAVEVGTNQMHPKLRLDPRIELHEQTDFRSLEKLSSPVDIMVADVSFISLREILPHASNLATKGTQIVAMVKPQFEAEQSSYKHKGVIKNDKMRREILKDFEAWAKQHFVIIDKADSDVAGEKGNLERFYLLKKV